MVLCPMWSVEFGRDLMHRLAVVAQPPHRSIPFLSAHMGLLTSLPLERRKRTG